MSQVADILRDVRFQLGGTGEKRLGLVVALLPQQGVTQPGDSSNVIRMDSECLAEGCLGFAQMMLAEPCLPGAREVIDIAGGESRCFAIRGSCLAEVPLC